MEVNKIKDICIKSCDSYYDYVKRNNKSRDEIKTTFSLPKDGMLSLKLHNKLKTLDGIFINIDGTDYFEPDAKIITYNEITKQLVVMPSERLLKKLTNLNRHEIKVISDLSWLIKVAKSFYESYGDHIGYPDSVPSFHKSDCAFSKRIYPLKDQEYAIRISLNNRLSYIWGPPGTGKTQCVITTCIMSYVLKGKRVAIIAPTNNALDHVLKSVLEEIQNSYSSSDIDIKKDVVRLGTATEDFFIQYPTVCTSKTITNILKLKTYTLLDLCNIREKITVESLKPAFTALSIMIRKYETADPDIRNEIRHNILDSLKSMEKEIMRVGKCDYIFKDLDEFNVVSRINQLIDIIYGKKGYGVVGELNNILNEKVNDWIREYESTIDEIKSSRCNIDINHAKILAMTPQYLMNHCNPDNFNVDHIFLDEANYSSVINTLPLFTFRVPITMCGDHMQLPPVCMIKRDDIVNAINKKSNEKYCMMWSLSALFSEWFLFKSLGNIVQSYCDNKHFDFEVTKQANLTTSYRFGNNLATILDKYVYDEIGLIGVAPYPVELLVIDAVSFTSKNNENEAEADAVFDYILKNNLKKKDYAILTPYKNQSFLLKNHPLRKNLKYSPNIMTIHASEGKEWDTLIISVVDDRPGKLLTSTVNKNGPGLNTINTAVSRAKKRLVLVCNKSYWCGCRGELITALIKIEDKHD